MGFGSSAQLLNRLGAQTIVPEPGQVRDIIRIFARWLFFERYKEIQIAAFRIETPIGCGSKQIKPLHPEAPGDSNKEFIGSSTQQIHILIYWLVPFCRCFDNNARCVLINLASAASSEHQCDVWRRTRPLAYNRRRHDGGYPCPDRW
jgi:hypothetical protein